MSCLLPYCRRFANIVENGENIILLIQALTDSNNGNFSQMTVSGKIAERFANIMIIVYNNKIKSLALCGNEFPDFLELQKKAFAKFLRRTINALISNSCLSARSLKTEIIIY